MPDRVRRLAPKAKAQPEFRFPCTAGLAVPHEARKLGPFRPPQVPATRSGFNINIIDVFQLTAGTWATHCNGIARSFSIASVSFRGGDSG